MKVGDILIDEGIITVKTLERTLEKQKRTGGKIGEVLKAMGIITETELISALNKQSSPFSDVTKRLKLGDALVDSGVISRKTLEKALDIQKRKKQKLGVVLENMGVLSDTELVEVLSKQLNMKSIGDFAEHAFKEDLLGIIPVEFVFKKFVFPIKIINNQLAVVIHDPFDNDTIDLLSRYTGLHIVPVLSAKANIITAIIKHYHKYSSRITPADILLIEEDKDIIEQFKKIASNYGLSLFSISNGNNAISQVTNITPKIIIANEKNCGISAENFMETIQMNLNENNYVSVLYTDSYNYEYEKKYIKSGFVDVFSMPCDLDRILFLAIQRYQEIYSQNII